MSKTTAKLFLELFLGLALLIFVDLRVCLADGPRTLRIGMSGNDVALLQNYLADQEIYPRKLVTGYFGRITELAVKVFQLKNGIPPVGIVGPKSRSKISELIAIQAQATKDPPMPIITASSSAVVIVDVATSSQTIQYNLPPKPNYDLGRLAKDIQNLVNVERQHFGLSPIYWDAELAGIAYDHSLDQAGDNLKLTDPAIVCHYPIIRHEGLTALNYSLKDRYDRSNINYRYGGENIAMIPVSKDLLYVQPSSAPAIVCKDVEKFLPGEGPMNERLNFFQTVLADSLDAVEDLRPVEWVQRQWRTPEELAKITVDGWMNSTGHRENILRSEFTVGGIGIAAVNDYIIITHDFVGR